MRWRIIKKKPRKIWAANGVDGDVHEIRAVGDLPRSYQHIVTDDRGILNELGTYPSLPRAIMEAEQHNKDAAEYLGLLKEVWKEDDEIRFANNVASKRRRHPKAGY